jgi:hypothetical protein
MNGYTVLADRQTYRKVTSYMEKLKAGSRAGQYLHDTLKHLDLLKITTFEFIELLMRTKRPQIFAESEVYGNGTDWNQDELSILGDLSIITPVTVYDNGKHRNPDLHEFPFAATLIFTPGALLRNGNNVTPVDWEAVTIDDKLATDRYYRLYERRFLPAFIQIDRLAKRDGKLAIVTVPGMGCGQFAGRFRGQFGCGTKTDSNYFPDNSW